MFVPFAQRFLPCLIVLTLGLLLPASASPVRFSAVETTYHSDTDADVAKTIDGIDASSTGWSVDGAPVEPQAAAFRCESAVHGGRIRLSLCFLSGYPGAHFNEFAISTTTDANPSLSGNWEKLVPRWFYSTGTTLSLAADGHLRSSGNASNTIFVVETPLPDKSITGFRIDVYPWAADGRPEHERISANRGSFVLTEFRAESFETATTNVALGCPVVASHEIWGSFQADFLTDGLLATFAHPRNPALGKAFFFQIDFRQAREFDHLSLRGRGDGQVPERLSRLTLELYENDPATGCAPVWQARHRADGSYPPPGGVDVIRASEGTGHFRGRYLRISSDSPVAYSPQIAEVEAYEPILPKLISMRADSLKLRMGRAPVIPAGTRWLAAGLQIASAHVPTSLPMRWRIMDALPEWRPVSPEGIAEEPCLPPGKYELQAQVGHTDGEWNDQMLRIPLIVQRPAWQEPRYQIAVGAVAAAAILLLVRYFAQRRLAVRVADLERHQVLDEERARIARDMHDVVGARLTQLAVMQEVFSAQHPQDSQASSDLHRLTSTAREAVSALDEVVWAVNPRNDTLQNVADYLCHCASEYLSPLGISCRHQLPEEWPARQMRAQSRHQLMLAFKEALQNVAKHAACTEATVALFVDGSHLVARLEDNGRGLPADFAGIGKDGLANMRTRLESVSGTCSINPRDGGGTVVEMRVPL